jgi:hypothetical protein
MRLATPGSSGAPLEAIHIIHGEHPRSSRVLPKEDQVPTRGVPRQFRCATRKVHVVTFGRHSIAGSSCALIREVDVGNRGSSGA